MARTKYSTLVPSKTIQVRVSDFEHGLRVFDEIQMVRIISEKYTLLIMNDFGSTVGSMSGNIEIVKDRDVEVLKGIKGFYLNRKNVLTLLIESQEKQ